MNFTRSKFTYLFGKVELWMSSTSEYKCRCLLWGFDFQKSVIMGFLLFAPRAEIKIFTYATFVTNTNYWEAVTAITADSIMNSILWFILLFILWFILWLFLFHLWSLIFFKYYTFFYLINYFRKHTTHDRANNFYFFTDMFFMMSLPFSFAFFFYFTMFNNNWVAFWINCKFQLSFLIFKGFL